MSLFGQRNEFERFVVLFNIIRLKGEVNYFISRGFLEVSLLVLLDRYSALNRIFHLKTFSLLYGWQ